MPITGSSECRDESRPIPDRKATDRSLEPAPETNEQLLCPSFAPRAPGKGVVIGLVAGTAERPRMIPLDRPEPVTKEIFELAAPHHPSTLFRIAAPCVEGACKNFGDGKCQLARAVLRDREATDDLPPCRIRPHCVWWHQEGKPACLRCPEVVTNTAATLAIRNEMKR